MINQEEICQLIASKLNVDISRVTMDADFIIDLGGDSLALAEMSALLEERLNVTLPPDQLFDVSTVGDLVKLIDNLA